jgi:hypothetical protein
VELLPTLGIGSLTLDSAAQPILELTGTILSHFMFLFFGGFSLAHGRRSLIFLFF